MSMSSDFTKFVKGKNFMTPDFIEYGRTGIFVYEITKGRGLDGNDIYGVTVVETDKCKRTELGKCVDSLEEAREYATTGLKAWQP